MLRSLSSSTVLLLTALSNLIGQELKVANLGKCELVSGEVIRDCRLGYRTVGTVAPDSSNVVLFPTWLSGTSERILALLGPEGLIDTSEYLVVVVDAFGNGVSSSPSNSTAQSDSEFPRVAIRDMVRLQRRLLTEHLGVSHLKAVVGVSMGGMQAFEWTKLIMEGVRPWENPFGAHQFGASFFMITGFHGMHVSAGVIYLLVIANRVRNGFYEKRGGNYEIVEITGLYWHFVDLVWVFIFAFFYLW